jgi:peroxiredoxin Q/BCP
MDAMPAQVGDIAPDFTLTSAEDKQVSLGEYKGKKHVILSFHVYNFTAG